MTKFCMNCGTQIDDNTKFCPNCGTAQNVAFAPVNQNPTPAPAHINPVYAGNGAVRNGIPAPGFSDRVNDPRILAAVKKNRRAAGVFTFFSCRCR